LPVKKAPLEMVLFPGFDKNRHLSDTEDVPVESTPENVDEYEFQRQIGMLCGKLIVE
jgi:plastocyanin domain-containing protein